MAGLIPNTFIDSLLSRVDIVDVIDRRVPLTRKGKEFQACCPFHDEKTPSFTVSPSKQFYHCFGCGAHGTAIGFLMDYANLSFVETVEELAEGVGLEVPREEGGSGPSRPPKEATGQLLGIVDEASNWFQQQLRTHPKGKEAIAYLKQRGLDGRVCARFGVGFAPDSRSGGESLIKALGTDANRIEQLHKAGLLGRSDNGDEYDRFRNRVIFPIEDHRGRFVAFGGRILGDGEPKYLNSPETSLFHKGAELYGLNGARREIGASKRSVVVEGYMDVVSLGQFGVNNAVATLGTATTRTHIQRLLRLAPEIVFCFDGDRAGRDAAWKAMQTALPELKDGFHVGFLFLPDGEDPDTIVRSQGADAFNERVANAMSLEEFLFGTLEKQEDMTKAQGKASFARKVSDLIRKLPTGSLQEMLMASLSHRTGLVGRQITGWESQAEPPRVRRQNQPLEPGQLSPMATAIAMLIQNPSLGELPDVAGKVGKLSVDGADHLQRMLEMINEDGSTNTARILEFFRESPVHGYLEKLASHPSSIASEAVDRHFLDTLDKLVAQQDEQRRMMLLEKSRQEGLETDEKVELKSLFDAHRRRIGSGEVALEG